MISYAFDQGGSNILVLTQNTRTSYIEDPEDSSNEIIETVLLPEKRVRVVDIRGAFEVDVLWHGKIENETLFGRLKSMLFQFIDGHLYYNNDVIKVRFDLLFAKDELKEYNEHEIFDYYTNIMPLKSKNEEV